MLMDMAEQVFYRKYRPKSFSEIIGQAPVVQTLKNALVMEKLAHAYIFSGPRGTGKTTLARILAKAANCQHLLGRRKNLTPIEIEPCNECSACQAINGGRSFDLVEIDAASNRGIDEIKNLREEIKFSPSSLTYKFFIIDEFHMLTREAFNALLKTLEEPPAHAIFVLATTEIHKVPQTIISRCQRFDFHKLTIGQITKRLEQIAQWEKIKIGKDALELMAFNADGALRDAESLFGQIASWAADDREISAEEVRNFFGVTDLRAAAEMINCLVKKDLAAAISLISQTAENGFDLNQFAKLLINYLRKMMILKADAALADLVAPELTEEQIKIILEQGARFSLFDLIKIIRIFIAAENEMRFASFTQLPLELAVVEILSGE